MIGFIRQDREIEDRAFAGVAETVLPRGCCAAFGKDVRGDAVFLQHIERRRMPGGGAKVDRYLLRPVDDVNGNALAREPISTDQPNRTCPHNQDTFIISICQDRGSRLDT